jgi:hypothetical protein
VSSGRRVAPYGQKDVPNTIITFSQCCKSAKNSLPSIFTSSWPHQRYHQCERIAVPLQVWSGPEGSRKLRFPDFMTTAQDGGKVVSLMYRPNLPPGNTPGTHFCYRLSRPHGHSAIGRIISLKNSNYTFWDRTSDLPICSAAP